MNKDTSLIRKRILEISHYGKDGNLQSCFSSVEILYALYHGGVAHAGNPACGTDVKSCSYCSS